MERLVQLTKQIAGVELSGSQVAAFEIYERELLDWNERFNLTAISDPEGVRIKHFLDSLTITLVWQPHKTGANLIDVGAGAGLPAARADESRQEGRRQQRGPKGGCARRAEGSSSR